MDNDSLTSLIVYLLGFAVMYFYSLKRDDECGLERNPREAFVFGLFWVVITPILIFWIVEEKITHLISRRKK